MNISKKKKKKLIEMTSIYEKVRGSRLRLFGHVSRREIDTLMGKSEC